jgi:hypothetical protein
MNPWTAIGLQSPAALTAGSGTFSAVASLTANGAGAQRGSGFLIHPSLLVTSAHVVTYVTDGRMWVAGRIVADFGQGRVGVARVAVPLSYIASLGQDAGWDMAVLRLSEPIADADVCLLVDDPPADGSVLPGVLWGNPAGARQGVAVEARCAPDKLTYTGTGNLPGWSGGPIARTTSHPESAVAVGIHRFWNETAHHSEAVRIEPSVLREALGVI